MADETPRKRDPFADEAKIQVDPVGALCDRIDWLRDQQIMLSVGTQGIVSGQQKTDEVLRTVAIKLAVLSERQLWVIGMAAAPCLVVLIVGVLAGWYYFHREFADAIAMVCVP